MSLEALNANLGPLDERIHSVRGFHGAQESAKSLRALLANGSLLKKEKKVRCQDAYTLRSTPQVIGAAHDAFGYARTQVEIELNGVGDNPIFFAEGRNAVSGANFQGSPIAVPMDMAGAALTMVCVLSERRMNRLNNPALSNGLPPFLSTNPGLMSGLMLSQYTADTLLVEQRMLSAPASIQSIPAAADQEDFVSMGMNTAIKNVQILENAHAVIGIEMFAAAQALDLRSRVDEDKYVYGDGVVAALAEVRKHVKFLEIDRPLYDDHYAIAALVKSGDVVAAAAKAVGPASLPAACGGLRSNRAPTADAGRAENLAAELDAQKAENARLREQLEKLTAAAKP